MRQQDIILGAICGVLAIGTAQGAGQAGEAKAAPVAQAVQSEAPHYERIGRFIYAFHRAGVSPEKLTDPAIARRAPPELAQRAAALAEKFDQIVKKQAACSDEEMKATLLEAQAVGAAIAQWRDGQAS